MKNYIFQILCLIGYMFNFVGCSYPLNDTQNPLFEKIPSSYTNINFSNIISYDKEFNVIDFPYIYNGGGVAAGDINNDGLKDLFFVGNMVTSRLYLNKGNFKFKDITIESGVATTKWASGVSMVDINNDGYLDIYVSVNGSKTSSAEERQNLLFINNQDNTFIESAAQYGLADSGYTTHAAFFDYDDDLDLDVFLINNFAGAFSRDNRISMRTESNDGGSKSTDKLYRNNGNGTFTDVSRQAGILKEGYSLGVAISDINRDGDPDIYVSNDILTDDILYINNGNGVFTDKSATYFKHTSYAGMGTDIADFNNDGWPDIIQADMMPPELDKQKMVSGASTYKYLQEKQQKGYQPQYGVNTLQLSNGRDSHGDIIYSDIAQLAGVAYTHWSWSSLFGDFNNDGLKDLMISNGYPKAVNDFDYLMKLSRSTMFGTDSTRSLQAYKLMDQLKQLKSINYGFKNNGNLTFTDVSERWGFVDSSFSYGVASADLDNDGDLDLAINNINDKAKIFKNRTDSIGNNHFLTIKLHGDSLNIDGIGTRLVLSANGNKQFKYINPYRGYLSTMERDVNFGLGKNTDVDSLELIWPDGRYQLLTDLKADQIITVAYKHAKEKFKNKDLNQINNQYFISSSNNLEDNYKHKENGFVDFDEQPLLPYMMSRLGPAFAKGDVNNDERDDIFLGGATGSAGKLFLQQSDDTFKESNQLSPWTKDKSYEDTDAIFFDANGDDLLDLYIVSGGNMYSPASKQLQDRLYLNTGEANFVKSEDMLPQMYTSGSTVKSGDYDNDGDLDLFIGGRLVPGQYPVNARSYILRNDKKALTDVTNAIAPGLTNAGLITDAGWIDFNNDGNLDLVITGEWMPVSFFENVDSHFKNITPSLELSNKIGWWQSLEPADVDEDGDIDFIVGNFGLNNEYHVSKSSPLYLFADDFEKDRQLDAILAKEKNEFYYSIHSMRNMAKQIPRLMRKVNSFSTYAEVSLSDILEQDVENTALKKSANYFASAVILNENGDNFYLKSLPKQAQLSSIRDILIMDLNKDNHLDLLLAGNIYHTNPEILPNDASNGLMLLGDGKGSFTPVSPFKSGFIAPLNTVELALVAISNAKYLITVNNNNAINLLRVRK